MENGTLTQATQIVLAGLVGLIGIAGIVLGFVTQINTLRAKAKAEKNDADASRQAELQKAKTEAALAIEAAKAEATKETESKLAFIALKDSVDAMNTTVSELSKGVGDRITGILKDQEKLCRRVDLVDASTRSAHKRMDEHRRVEHNLKTNNHFTESEDESVPDPEP